MVRAAEAVGLDAIAITDEVRLETSREELSQRVEEIRRVSDRSSIAVIPGGVCELLDATGRLSLPPDAEHDLPLVLAAIGPTTRGIAREVPASGSRMLENVFGAYSAVVRERRVDVIADPFNLGRFQAPLGPADLPRAHVRDLARLMVKHEVALELSARAWWWHPGLKMGEFERAWASVLAVFAIEDVKFVAGTGARSAAAVGNNYFTRRMMRLSGIELSQVVNLHSLAGRDRRR
jgi:histidinol phosphatase-like PHP family hydrolase